MQGSIYVLYTVEVLIPYIFILVTSSVNRKAECSVYSMLEILLTEPLIIHRSI